MNLTKIFFATFVLLYLVISIRIGFEFIRPVLPWLCPAVVAGIVAWLFFSWRKSRW